MTWPKIRRQRPRPHITLMPLARKKRRSWWRWGRWVALSLLTVIVFALVCAAYYYPRAKQALAAARQAEALARQLPSDFSQQNFAAAKSRTTDLKTALETLDHRLSRMQGLAHWPYVGRQYRAVDSLVNVGHASTEAISALVDFAAHLFEPFADRGRISLAAISPADKGKLLAGITEREDALKIALASINQAAAELEGIPDEGLVQPLQHVLDPLKQQFPLIKQGLEQAIPATHILPAVLGYPEQKTYLFLFENNTELRPGGGFIGTYGLMKVNSGEIVSLNTDNSYNLDEAAKDLPVVTPPQPIVTYLKVRNWYFRDSNWSPDFPSSADQSMVLYKREGGVRNLDGVIAVTPTAISALLKLVGPITVEGIEFTPENFTEKLQSYVDRGYVYSGRDASQRKDIIGPMTTELVDRLLKLPLSDWGDLFLVLNTQLAEKQLLLSMEDPAVQSVLEDLRWNGSVRTVAGDYLMAVDANLASLKTDAVMKRHYAYQLNLSATEAIAHLTITYTNTGKFDWKTTRYNTYVRVYVPAGSELLESSGSQRREKSNREGTVTTTAELGKTVFGTFKSIEPGTTSTLMLKYRLPAEVAEQLRQKQYTLSWQKQAGMVEPTIAMTITVDGRPSQSCSGLDNQAVIRKDTVSFTGPLVADRDIICAY